MMYIPLFLWPQPTAPPTEPAIFSSTPVFCEAWALAAKGEGMRKVAKWIQPHIEKYGNKEEWRTAKAWLATAVSKHYVE